jgi:hypothetical protein
MGVFRREPIEPTRRTAIPPSRIVQVTPTGFTPAEAVAYSAPRALTAAAARVPLNDKGEAEYFKNRRSSTSSAWQSEAWEYYDAIGEIKYAFNLVASVVSRIRLYAAVIDNPAETPVSVRGSSTVDQQLASAAERALARLDSAYGGQAGLLRDAALNLSVTGECYLVQMPARPGSGIPESWDIRSVDEVQVDAKSNYAIAPRRDFLPGGQSGSSGNQRGLIPLPNKAFVGRIWRAHPRFSDEADSSLRGLLDLCAELLLLNRTFRATARSRLNAGALYLPDGLSVAASADPDYPYDDTSGLEPGLTPEESQDEFEDALMDAMTTPIRDEDSASAVVPLIIRGPAELGDKIKQFKFERSFDPALAQRSDRVLERILQGLDVPKDVITGLANVKYSNAMQIDESLYKSHIEPLMLLIADALTVAYLRPYLVASGFNEADVERLVIWYDPSQVSTRNDRAADADAGFDKMAVSYDTWRRMHGFSETDAPTPDEVALRMVIEKGMISPELAEAVLGAIAPNIINASRAAQQSQSVAPIPPEVAQMLQGGQPPAGAPGEPPSAPPNLAEPEPAQTPEGVLEPQTEQKMPPPPATN